MPQHAHNAIREHKSSEIYSRGFPGKESVVKSLPANAGDAGFNPWVGNGEGDGNLLQYPCLENAVNRGAWRAMLHRIAKSRTRLKLLSTQAINKYIESH